MKYCLGTVQFGMDYGIQGNGQPDKNKVFEMLSYAADNGIDVMDTASSYGEAETLIGEFFRQYSGDKSFSVISKLKPDAFEGKPRDSLAETAVKNAGESLDKLNIKQFSCYLFHNASYIFNGSAVNALNAVRDAGLAERIGVSAYTPQEAMKALEYQFVTAIQIPYNVFDRRLDHCGFFEKLKERSAVVYARSSLLQGLLTMEPEKLPSNLAFAGDYLKTFRSICEKYGISPLKAAVGYVGSKQEIDYVVFGVDNIEQLREYVSIRDTALPEPMVRDIDKAFDNVPEKLVNPVLWK